MGTRMASVKALPGAFKQLEIDRQMVTSSILLAESLKLRKQIMPWIFVLLDVN